jgi:hypothetical protein
MTLAGYSRLPDSRKNSPIHSRAEQFRQAEEQEKRGRLVCPTRTHTEGDRGKKGKHIEFS